MHYRFCHRGELRRWLASTALPFTFALGLLSTASAPLPPLARAGWIWGDPTNTVCEIRKVFTLEARPTNATVLITADNGYELFVNGSQVGSDVGAASEVWQSVERYDITARLAQGRNIIGIRGLDLGGIRGVIAAARVELKSQPALELVTDGTWRTASEGQPVDYSHPEFVEGREWSNARVLGPMGMVPWGKVAWSASAEKARAKNRRPPLELAAPGKDFVWPERVAFLGDDCSVYVPLRGDAWGVAFRVGDWSRAYTEFDLPCPAKIGRKLWVLSFNQSGVQPSPDVERDSPSPLNGERAGVRGGSDEQPSTSEGSRTRPPRTLTLSPLRGEGTGNAAVPATPQLILDAGSGAIGSPSVTFDGSALLVSAALGGEKFFHIYRVPAGGGRPQRLTDGPFHDLDPVELPDGRLAFASTRIGTFEEYHQPPSRALFRMNADGSDIQPITFTPIFDNEPKVMADGRIAFIRTDNFFDRGKVETQLHIMRPDGTDGFAEIAANVGADYGSRLRAFGYGSPAPLPDGRLAFISSRGNFIASGGAPEREFHRLPDSLGDLAALPDGRLLCTVLRSDGRRMNSDVLGVIDPRDNRVVTIHQSTAGSIHSPVFLGPRVRPPVIPDYAETNRATGFLFCQDARFTTKSKAGWDNVRAIRVLAAKALTTRSSHSHIVHVGHETVELGTVPLARDGSFFIEVPANLPLAMQAVDAEGRSELNEMSWIYVRPGERRSCLGCHHPREATPTIAARSAESLRGPALKLTGQGDPHHFRGNNPGVTGLMDLQFERFRECASLNRNALRSEPMASGRDEMAALIRQLTQGDEGHRISSAQRLALLRERDAAPALAAALASSNREVRVAAALALAPCGTRESVPALVAALRDKDEIVARAAHVSLENLTGQDLSRESWPRWLASNSWPEVEARLIQLLRSSRREEAPSYRSESDQGLVTSAATERRTVVALGHIGGEPARMALRDFVVRQAATNPYPKFVNDNRTDTFTFAAASPWNPRPLQEAVRALGQLRDTNAVPLLGQLLAKNINPTNANLFLAEAVIEALGRIGSPEAESALLEAFAELKDYWHYVGWYSDHPALYACHSSPVHTRIIEALERIGSTRAAGIAPQLIRSVPTDPDRGLFLDNDDYETLVGRLIRRSGRGAEVVETCLALLGDSRAQPRPEIQAAIAVTHPAWGGHPGPENRAAQILSLVCRDSASEPRVRAAFARYVAKPEEPVQRALGNPTWTPVRHWVLFYLGRTLGQLRDRASVPVLTSVLGDDLNEARHGRPDPSQPEIHLLHLEYTPCWRAAAAWALGQIGDASAAPALLGAVRNLDNATDVRHAAAVALGQVAALTHLDELHKLAAGYPEISTRRALLLAIERHENKRGPRSEAPATANH